MTESAATSNGLQPTAGMRDNLLALIFRLYKVTVSPVLQVVSPSRCLYLPTCSEYAYTAISRFGVIHGTYLAARRLSRCHPWGKGGLDPVPERLSSTPCCAHAATSRAGQNTIDHLP